MAEPSGDGPLVERVKIQAELLVPIVRTLEAELGVERAHELVRRALGEHYRDIAARWVAARGSLGALDTFVRVSTAGGALDVTNEMPSDSGLSFDVTGCRYADFYRAIGEPELGFLLVCSSDHDLVDGMPGVSLDREQTIMQGAETCTFRYRFDPRTTVDAAGETDTDSDGGRVRRT